MEIRNFAEEDIGELSEIILSVYDESPEATTFKSRPTVTELLALSQKKLLELRNRERVDIIATIDGGVVANCEMARRAHGEGYIGIIVAQKHRRKGIGSSLVEKCIYEARALGMHRIYAEINKKNSVALLFFSKCGFRDYNDGEIKVMVREMH